MSASSLRIVVSGLAGTYPLGGMFWHYMQFVLGLHRLGHDVLYLEDTSRWCYCPQRKTFVESGDQNANYLGRELARLDANLAGRWHFRDAADEVYGRSWQDVVEFCQSADLFLNISASAKMRDEYRACGRLAFIDTDPMYTQAAIPDYVSGEINDELRARVETLLRYDVFFTFGENVGNDDCLVPKELVPWIPTRQPIVLDCFTDLITRQVDRRKVLTTVASWDPTESRTMVRGVAYYGKSVEFERLIDLPQHSALPLEIALSGDAPVEKLCSKGWKIRDGHEVSYDPWTYREYVSKSLGEWSIAKHAYVASRSGWFSCRTASYLALGVPAIVQDTAFSIPTGRGLLSFTTFSEAVAAIDQLASQPARHARAARELAMEYFDSRTVLSRLVDGAMNYG